MCGRARIGADAIDHMRYIVQQQQRRRGRSGNNNNNNHNNNRSTGSSARRGAQGHGHGGEQGQGQQSTRVGVVAEPSNCGGAHAVAAFQQDAHGDQDILPRTEKQTVGGNQVSEQIIDYIDTTDYASLLAENVGPGSKLPVICANKRNAPSTVTRKCWGLIPSYNKSSKLDFFQMFNKRVETLEQSTWKHLTESNRCVFVCDGFYEWKTMGGKNQPHYVHMREPMVMAAIYDKCTVNGSTIESFALITCDSTAKFKPINDRQPIFLTEDQQNRWLNGDLSPNAVSDLLIEVGQNSKDPSMPFNSSVHFYPVSSKVTNPSYQGEDCSKLFSLGKDMKSFFKSVPSPNKMVAQEQQKQQQKQQQSFLQSQQDQNLLLFDGKSSALLDAIHRSPSAAVVAVSGSSPPQSNSNCSTSIPPQVGDKRNIIEVIVIDDDD